MIYAQFYQKSANSDDIIEACGDRAVITLDGRYMPSTNGQIAEQECIKRGFIAWRVFKGDSFTRSKAISQLWFVHKEGKEKTPSWLSAHGM